MATFTDLGATRRFPADSSPRFLRRCPNARYRCSPGRIGHKKAFKRGLVNPVFAVVAAQYPWKTFHGGHEDAQMHTRWITALPTQRRLRTDQLAFVPRLTARSTAGLDCFVVVQDQSPWWRDRSELLSVTQGGDRAAAFGQHLS